LLTTTGLFAGLIAALALVLLTEPALAKKPRPYMPRMTEWYRLSGDINVRCIERSFSVSVGNPAYPNRVVYWPAPCRP
jgi:hypothetical protein